MAARSRSFQAPALAPSHRIGGVAPAWLVARLGSPTLRILDVRSDEPSEAASGPRLRAAGNVELRAFAHLGGP
ncbi:MAG TPA: hypothetical protein VLT33_06925, partial [Labilithrix sp.]|nr:hypothetical protein [Labilithrix sp.]